VLSAILTDRFKYVHFSGLPPLLFDLEADPHEMHNVADNLGYRDVRLDMAERTLSWRMRHADRTLSNIMLTAQGPIERHTRAVRPSTAT
jgi:arylsulfatase A-like enzyme